MSKGIYTAVSGAIAQTAKLDTIANNLANVNTPAFKRDSQIFKEYVTAYQKEPSTITVPRIPASIESFYDMNGGDKSYVDLDGTNTDFSQGFMKSTGNPLDVAIEGDGFFEVLTPQGPRLTRAGSFAVSAEGKLVTKQGYPVLSEGAPGSDPAGRTIELSGNNPISISDSGEIFENNASVGKLSLVTTSNKDGLQKIGENLYSIRTNINPDITPAVLKTSEGARITQGFLEGSNVNPIREMTDMIATSRTFESTQKAIQAYDDMQKKLVTDVPKLG
jgi:flagellar basal-body rod protein FlgG